MEKNKGIYMIENKANGMVYIGKSVNINARFKSHFLELGRGNGNKKIQKDYDIYGLDSFETKILEFVEASDDLEDKETAYIQKFNSIIDGYNCRPAKHEGYNYVTTCLNNKYCKTVLETAKKEGLSVSGWLRKIAIERIEQNDSIL